MKGHNHRYPPLRFGLRTLLLLFSAASISFGIWTNQADRQRQAVGEIRRLGGSVCYDYEVESNGCSIDEPIPPGPGWLRTLLGIDYFSDVAAVHIEDRKISDSDLEQIKSLGELKSLAILNTNITDDDVKDLRRLSPDARCLVWPVPVDVIAKMRNRIDAIVERMDSDLLSDEFWSVLGLVEYRECSELMGLRTEDGNSYIRPAGFHDGNYRLRRGHDLVVHWRLDGETRIARAVEFGGRVWGGPVTRELARIKAQSAKRCINRPANDSAISPSEGNNQPEHAHR